MYTEWRDANFFPEIVYSDARTEWIKNMPFNKCFVHAAKGGSSENVEEVTIPVLSELDEKWCRYSANFIERMAKEDRPWFLYHCTRGAHFDNYPNERFFGKSPARHPYKDTLLELDEVMGRLVETLRETDQLEDTLIFVTSDNGAHMETWPDSAFTPFRCAKGSTWEGGVRVPGLLYWPGMIDAGRQSDGLFDFNDVLPTVLAVAGETARLPGDRYIDGVDQSSSILAPDCRAASAARSRQVFRTLASLGRGGNCRIASRPRASAEAPGRCRRPNREVRHYRSSVSSGLRRPRWRTRHPASLPGILTVLKYDIVGFDVYGKPLHTFPDHALAAPETVAPHQ